MSLLLKDECNNSRRDFLKKTTFAGVGVSLAGVAAAFPQATDARKENIESTGKFTILYTSDIHAQLNTHDEFFWENGKAVYRKRGG